MRATYRIEDLGARMEATGARYSVTVKLFDDDGNLVNTECCERRSREVAEATVDVYCDHHAITQRKDECDVSYVCEVCGNPLDNVVEGTALCLRCLEMVVGVPA